MKKRKPPAAFAPTSIPMHTTIDLDKLPPNVRIRIQRELAPRDTVMSVRVSKTDLDKWKKASDAEGVFFVDWVEAACNERIIIDNLHRALSNKKGKK